jgi:integrase/recombinase XerD
MKKLILKNTKYQQLEQAFEAWLFVLGYSESSRYNLPVHVREFLYYQETQNKELRNWSANDFDCFIKHCSNRKNERRTGGLSSAHINKMIHALDLLQQYLRKVNQLDFYYKIPRLVAEPKVIAIFSQTEIKQLYEACDDSIYGFRNKVLLGLCYGCGLRKGEAIDLELEDIWWDKKLLQVRKSKTKKSRLVPITNQVLNDLKQYKNQARILLLQTQISPFFLVNNRGKKLGKQAFYKSFIQLLERANLEARGLHSLRHSIASHLAASGMKSEQIAQFLGHQTLDSTQIYVHYKNKSNEHKKLFTNKV